jgi:toxin ParE1/3/4
MIKLRINPLVVTDLIEIRNFIAEDNVDNATKTLKELYEKFENLQHFPHIGTGLSKRVKFRTEYKYLPWKDYVIIYKVSKSYIEIYRVINRYQDFTAIFD